MTAADFPADGLPEVAMVGRSNVGKSSLINALVRTKVARTSSTPGKTRLVNFYRVKPGPTSAGQFYLVDLPGFGHADGGRDAEAAFERITAEYFGSRGSAPGTGARPGRPSQAGESPLSGVLFIVDSRHPGLANDRQAHAWLTGSGLRFEVVATKIDKLSRADRARASAELQRLFERPVAPASATTGEGMAELWKLLLNWTASR